MFCIFSYILANVVIVTKLNHIRHLSKMYKRTVIFVAFRSLSSSYYIFCDFCCNDIGIISKFLQPQCLIFLFFRVQSIICVFCSLNVRTQHIISPDDRKLLLRRIESNFRCLEDVMCGLSMMVRIRGYLFLWMHFIFKQKCSVFLFQSTHLTIVRMNISVILLLNEGVGRSVQHRDSPGNIVNMG